LVIAISSRALFDLDEANRIFEERGLSEYAAYQIEHEDEPLQPGVAFPLIKRLLALGAEDQSVEVVLVSRNDCSTGLRVLNSAAIYDLNIRRAAFTGGSSPYIYLEPFKADLFLSADPGDVRLALDQGYAAATILTGMKFADDETDELRIAFDGDAVLFSDEAERVYATEGLDGFRRNEAEKADVPLQPGPFKGFIEGLNRLQAKDEGKRLRTALVTARGVPAHKRAIKTLRAWGVRIDEAFFLEGLDKSAILQAFGPHIYFDDQKAYCDPASKIIPTGHVPSGIRNDA
jgi:5'-nucleotidase